MIGSFHLIQLAAIAISIGLAASLIPPVPVLAQSQPRAATSSRNMVATVHPLATSAGIDALEQGGNAIDAAVAAALTLGVVDGYNSGIGGGCFVLIRTSDGNLVAIDGREMAPAAAHRDMFLVDGKPDTRLSQTGPLAVGVPGALAAYEQAVAGHGRLSLDRLIEPAARIAEEGFEVSPVYADNLKATAETLSHFPGSRAVLLRPDGSPWETGEILRQPDLAKTCRHIAEEGTEWFYKGDFARRTGEWMSKNGGILTADDFAAYTTIRRKPLETTWRGFTIIGFPPPGSGGVHVAQILNILEQLELSGADDRRAETVHVIAEAMKLAFADRAYWLGDPDFVNVPSGLIDKDYARELAARIDPAHATPVTSHGTPPRADEAFFEKHTTHVAAADDEGNWVAITTTVNTTFGSKVIVPGLGVVLNNQMDDFAIAPGVPNAFGLVGTEANSVQPGKRPLSSMSPTIVLREGRPVMTVGAAGGPKIITQVVLAILRHLQFERDLADSLAEPRFHHQWSPDLLMVEKGTGDGERGFDAGVARQLESFGHKVRWTSASGVTQAITFDPATGIFTGVHDPRVPGTASGQQ